MVSLSCLIEQLETCSIELNDLDVCLFELGLNMYKPHLTDTVQFIPVTDRIEVLTIATGGKFVRENLLPEFTIVTSAGDYKLNYYKPHHTVYIFMPKA